MKPNKKILIVGGGIAGTTLAAFLKDSEYDVTIIERSPEWRTIGFGLGVLKKLDMPESFWNQMQPVGVGAVVDPLGNVLYEIKKQNVGVDQMAKEIAREELHAALVQKIPHNTSVRFGVTCKNVESVQNGSLVTFSDDTQEFFDLVVGADGVRSSVREKVFGNQFLHSYGWHAVVGWIPAGSELFPDYHIMNTPGAVLLAIPYGDRLTIAFSVPKTPDSSAENILETFEAMNPRIKKLVSMLDRDHLFYDEIVHVKMNEWYKGNVVLIGDARHGMSPISGFGTSLALSDAYELAQCLKEFPSVSQAVKTFAKRRTRNTKSIFLFAWLMEKVFTMKSSLLISVRNFILKFAPRYSDSLLKDALGLRGKKASQ